MSKRILVVEDQEDLRGVLRDLLTGSGYTVLEARDGEAGVAKANSDRPDLILMDIEMPVIDGYEAARRIKADPFLKPIPIIAVSSFAIKGDEEKARELGPAGSRLDAHGHRSEAPEDVRVDAYWASHHVDLHVAPHDLLPQHAQLKIRPTLIPDPGAASC